MSCEYGRVGGWKKMDVFGWLWNVEYSVLRKVPYFSIEIGLLVQAPAVSVWCGK